MQGNKMPGIDSLTDVNDLPEMEWLAKQIPI